MGMWKAHHANCDDCGSYYEDEAPTRTRLIEMLDDDAWTVTRTKTLCPYCNGTHEKDDSLIRI